MWASRLFELEVGVWDYYRNSNNFLWCCYLVVVKWWLAAKLLTIKYIKGYKFVDSFGTFESESIFWAIVLVKGKYSIILIGGLPKHRD